MKQLSTDIAVIGAGAAGLSAATVTAKAGRDTLVIDRESYPGGILRQCLHNGFGLQYFHEELTGPEYAGRMIDAARKAGAKFLLDTTVAEIARLDDDHFQLYLLSAADGVIAVQSKAIVLAMGCRERNRGNIGLPGGRPAGIFTAGTAQRLINLEGVLPGCSAVIVGSGDIGLIMARRLRWSGIVVKGVVEIMPSPAGLTRNIVQCLHDFDIPLYLSHTVTRICGRDRVEGVDVAPLTAGAPDISRQFHLSCDTLLFSVGLIPENELSVMAGVELDATTGGARVDSNYETSVPGIFAAGNVLHVHDLVDFVSEEAERMAASVLRRLDDTSARASACPVKAGANIRYVVPAKYIPGQPALFSFRPMIVCDHGRLTAELNGKTVLEKRLAFIRPAEMLRAELPADTLVSGELTFSLQPEENA